MKEISKVFTSLNETSRLCTHEISGYVHLLAFCVEEINSDSSGDHSKFIEKISEAAHALEKTNELWKTSTIHFTENVDEELRFVVSKSEALCQLYSKSLIKDLKVKASVTGTCCGTNAYVLSEALFAALSTLVRMAFEQGLEKVTIEIEQVNGEYEFYIFCHEINFNEKLYNKIISLESEEEKTVRRFSGVSLMKENGLFEYIQEKSCSKIRIQLC